MRALVYHGPGRKSWDEVPEPEITDDGDIIVRVDATTICGTDSRLEAARHFGADITVNNSREDPLTVIKDLTGRMGANVSIEAVGRPATFELAVKLARPGGRIANIGVHGGPVSLRLDEQWIRDITITTGLKDTSSTPTLMRLVTGGQIDAKRFITHRFGLDEFEAAYDVCANAADNGALKVVLSYR